MSARRIPIERQVEEIEKEVGRRANVYPRLVERGQMTDFEADECNAAMAAALASLRIIAEHREGLRKLIGWLRAADLQPSEVPDPAELEALRNTPAIAALLEAFPEAKIESVLPVAIPAPTADESQAGEQLGLNV